MTPPTPSRPPACPDDDELRAFALGDVDEERLEELALHAAECARCERRLDALDDSADALVEGLRGSRDAESSAPVPSRLVDVARSAPGSSSGEPTIDPGRRIARDLARGSYRLGRFELFEELGVGSFGYVFRAHDTELDRTVAIKLQRAALPEHHEDRARFLREARSAAQLEHPNIVSLYETGETAEGVAYLVTEYIEGETLETRVRRGALEPRDAARIVSTIARALAAAHARGVVHRDVKPSNVVLDASGEPHVMDFGLAKRDSGEVTVTPSNAVMGTPAYMSPEVARGEAHRADARSDVYSVGVILYELLVGSPPFRGNRRMLVLQVLEDEPTAPRRLDDKIPRDLETICLTAMQKSPARRYASASELADDLDRFLARESIVARPIGRLERAWRWGRRNQLAAALFVSTVLGAGFGFWHLSRLSRSLVRSAAVESAAQYSEMLEAVNEVYSSEVVDRAGEHGIDATAEYATAEGVIPLPATLLAVLLECISDRASGMSGRHYSEYPFAFRENGGPHSELEWEALRTLRERPDEPFERFIEDDEGRPALFYATARRMQESCVACHNNHPDSVKRDWRVGDVRGVLEIIRPLDLDEERTANGLRSSFVSVGAVSLLLFASFASLVLLNKRRRPPA